jgi:predicted oxidoreductase
MLGMGEKTDVIVVGAGIAGLVAATEIAKAGKRVVVVDQEAEQNLGGQAFWSLGGLFMVDTPEQRRCRIKDSFDLAMSDWIGSAGFDRPEDHWPRKWAEAYVAFAAGEMRPWLREQGMRWFPIVGWAERGGYGGSGHGNSVPRFHITWGSGPGVVAPFVTRARDAERSGKIQFRFRHRVDGLMVTNKTVEGVRGAILEPSSLNRGVKSSRNETGNFEIRAQAVIVASGGIGGDFDRVRKNWPKRMGEPPQFMVQGVPDYVDGRMLEITEASGARLINRDRMWHYTEGLRNWNPIWSNHGIRILPGPSSLWLDANGKRLPPPLFPGFDNLGALEHILRTGYDYSWFVLDQQILQKEFALSGSEQNPDFTNKNWRGIVGRARAKKATGPVEAFKEHGRDFVVARNVDELVKAMNELAGRDLLESTSIEREISARDSQLDNRFGKDLQIAAIRQARNYLGDKLIRTTPLHRILDPKAGPLIAVKLNILTRKTLGGFETDLFGRVFATTGEIFPGLYAAGEASGFGGGGVHGYRALEGSFLGGCIFSGRAAGRAAAAALA